MAGQAIKAVRPQATARAGHTKIGAATWTASSASLLQSLHAATGQPGRFLVYSIGTLRSTRAHAAR